MSYDFMFLRVRRDLAPFPASVPADLDEDTIATIADAAPLQDALRASPLADAGSLSFDDATRFTWRTPDGGTLEVHAMPQALSVRAHAHWHHVAQLFELARGVWPETLLFDLQQGHVHDQASFRAAIERNDRELADYRARTGAGR